MGTLGFELLPAARDVTFSRLYSPTFLEEGFAWPTVQDVWDGIICEVDWGEIVTTRCLNAKRRLSRCSVVLGP